MNPLSTKLRVWGSIAHMPIVTIIWASYLVYRYVTLNDTDIHSFWGFDFSSVPLTPILLTLASLPISLTLMQLKKKSVFIYDNAHAAYLYNMWLLKAYVVIFITVFTGIKFSMPLLISVAEWTMAFISILTCYQSVRGVYTALNGRVFNYWYPGHKCT